jgi:hypothetical protein
MIVGLGPLELTWTPKEGNIVIVGVGNCSGIPNIIMKFPN